MKLHNVSEENQELAERVSWQRRFVETDVSESEDTLFLESRPPERFQLQKLLGEARPPPPPPREDAPLVIAFVDLEVRGSDGIKDKSGIDTMEVQEISIVAVKRQGDASDDDKPFVVVDDGWYDWDSKWTSTRSGREGVIKFIKALTAIAGEGGHIIAMAHNHKFDLKYLKKFFEEAEDKEPEYKILPACLKNMIDSKDVFLTGIKKKMGNSWSLAKIYEKRFGEEIPGRLPHSAYVDTTAMLRIFRDVSNRKPDQLRRLEDQWLESCRRGGRHSSSPSSSSSRSSSRSSSSSATPGARRARAAEE